MPALHNPEHDFEAYNRLNFVVTKPSIYSSIHIFITQNHVPDRVPIRTRLLHFCSQGYYLQNVFR
jgi:hypothetical protein